MRKHKPAGKPGAGRHAEQVAPSLPADDIALRMLQSLDGSAEQNRKRADVKRRLLERANEYVKEGNYPFALSEIRRIYVFDPADVDARQYEGVIHRLITEDRPVVNLLSALQVGSGGVVTEGGHATAPQESAPASDTPRKFSFRERLLKTKRSWRLLPPSDPA